MSNSAGRDRALAELLRCAMALHQCGDLVQARSQYQAILRAYPKQFETLYCLGMLELQMGQWDAARGLIRRALQLNPASAQAHLGMGNVYHAQNNLKAALSSYDRALAIRPDYAEAYYNRGNTLLDLGRLEPALASYERALAIVPDYIEVLNNRGNVLHELERYDEALASYDRALASAPGYTDAWNSRGNALQALKQHTQALACYDQALAIEPDFVDALTNRGSTLRDLKRYAEALASLDGALAIAPDSVKALINRGMLLFEIGQRADALASYDRALAIDPMAVEALNNRADVLIHAGRPEDAVLDYERMLTIRPSGGAYLPGGLLHARMQCCDWSAYDENRRRLISAVRAGEKAASPFFLLGISDSTADQLMCARVWVSDKCPAVGAGTWTGKPHVHDRIRIAYLSSDLRDHPVAYLTAGLFERHDRAHFEITAISFGSDDSSEMRSRLKRAFDSFIDVRQMSDPEVAKLLREREIDIAVDLNGHTLESRSGILALRPAPVQVSYLGYPGTLGATYIDYILADPFVIPGKHRESYSECVAYLPDAFQANDARRLIAENNLNRAGIGLPEEGIVFCAFNRGYKITPAQFDIWMRLLHRVEGSVLWLARDNAALESNLCREAVQRGVAAERLVFAPWMKYENHLARYRFADLFLDTLPFNAGTTASDALWAGLPVLTCCGESFASRMAGSLLHAVGLPELIAPTVHDYETLAVSLATRPGLLAQLRAKLALNRTTHPLFDTDRFCRHVEAAYLTMWERHQRGERPADFNIERIQ